MPKRKVPTVPRGFVVQADLVSFAVEHGYRNSVATRLWNLLAGSIAPDLKAKHDVTLDVQCLASPGKEWPPAGKIETLTPTEMRHGWMISIKTLTEAKTYLNPNFSMNYGAAMNRLLQEWVESME
jgi:hypothetical protein